MKLHWVLLLTHGTAAGLGACAMALAGWSPYELARPLGVAMAVLGTAGLCWFLAGRIRIGLRSLERAVATGNGVDPPEAGIADFDVLTERIREYVSRWSDLATRSRAQSQETDELLSQINRRCGDVTEPGRGTAASQLRGLLASLTQTVDGDLRQILAFTGEIERQTREFVSGTEEQADGVSKTTTYIEQMSTNIDAVSDNASTAHEAAVGAREAATQALELIRELTRGMDRIRLQVEASEKKLRALGDRSHEIGSIVETIGTISARTDLLALNASIESVRAGEHGRGFAVVAEEVRKLAEQAAQATREVSGLVESVQLETQESIAVMGKERAQVEEEVRRVNAAGEALQQISRSSSDSATRVGEILRTAQGQLHLVQDVVVAVERVSEVTKATRSRADGLGWTARTLGKQTRHLHESVSPLRACSESPGDAPIRGERTGDRLVPDGRDSDSTPAVDPLNVAQHSVNELIDAN